MGSKTADCRDESAEKRHVCTMQEEKHLCIIFWLEMNPGSILTIQNKNPNWWSMDTKFLQFLGISRLLLLQERSCSLFSGTWNFQNNGKLWMLSNKFQHSELSVSDVFGVIRTQSCNSPHNSRQTQGALRQLDSYDPTPPCIQPWSCPLWLLFVSLTQKVLKGPSLSQWWGSYCRCLPMGQRTVVWFLRWQCAPISEMLEAVCWSRQWLVKKIECWVIKLLFDKLFIDMLKN